MKACFQIAERRISYAKIPQASAMKACFQIAERRISYAKIPQASAMKACFQIAERRISYAKIIKKLRIIVRNRVFFVLSSFSFKVGSINS